MFLWMLRASCVAPISAVRTAAGYFEPAAGEKKNVAALQHSAVIGRVSCAFWSFKRSVYRARCSSCCSIVEHCPQCLKPVRLQIPEEFAPLIRTFFRIVPELGLYVLADGMGGARGGARASQLAVETVDEILRKSPHRDAAALLGAVEEANQRVLDEATRDPRFEGMGTTLVAALWKRGERRRNRQRGRQPRLSV